MIKASRWKTAPPVIGIKDAKIKWNKIKGAANSDGFLIQSQVFRHRFGYGIPDADQYVLSLRIFF